MALTVIFALLGSLVLSLTLMPVLTSLLLPRRMSEKEPWPVRAGALAVRSAAAPALRHGLAVLLLTVAALAAAVLLAVGLGSEAVPRLSEGSLVVSIVPPGWHRPRRIAALQHRDGANAVARSSPTRSSASGVVAARPRSPPTRWGRKRPICSSRSSRANSGRKAATQAELADRIRDLFKDLPGQRISLTQPIEQRMDEMTSGVKAQVAVKLFGDDFTTLKATADKLAAVLRKVPNSTDVAVEQITGLPVLQIQVKQEELARYNVPARAVLDVVESVGGKVAGRGGRGPIAISVGGAIAGASPRQSASAWRSDADDAVRRIRTAVAFGRAARR